MIESFTPDAFHNWSGKPLDKFTPDQVENALKMAVMVNRDLIEYAWEATMSLAEQTLLGIEE